MVVPVSAYMPTPLILFQHLVTLSCTCTWDQCVGMVVIEQSVAVPCDSSLQRACRHTRYRQPATRGELTHACVQEWLTGAGRQTPCELMLCSLFTTTA